MTRAAILIDGGFLLKKLPSLGVTFPEATIENALQRFNQLPRHPRNQIIIGQQQAILDEIVDELDIVLPFGNQNHRRQNAVKRVREILIHSGTQAHIRVAQLHATQIAEHINRLVNNHLFRLNKIACVEHHRSLLYRCFFYDGRPFEGSTRRPVSKDHHDFRQTPEYAFRQALFDEIRRTRNFALRLGETSRDEESFWQLLPSVHKQLLSGKRTPDELTDDDFKTTLRQRAVDLRFGLDIATITLKKQADTFILVTGDSDFVPAAKLARREGCQVILDPLHQSVKPALHEHIDKLYSGFQRPNARNHAGSDRQIEAATEEISDDD